MSGMYDARISAWVAAQDFLAAATELQRKFPDEPSAAAHIDRYHRAADIYARLASAPARVGQAAGDAIARREEVEE